MTLISTERFFKSHSGSYAMVFVLNSFEKRQYDLLFHKGKKDPDKLRTKTYEGSDSVWMNMTVNIFLR